MRRSFAIEYEASAQRSLKILLRSVRDALQAAILELAEDPVSPETRAMRGKGEGLYRIRMGDCRIVYRVIEEHNTIRIVRIGSRATVYRGLEPRRDSS